MRVVFWNVDTQEDFMSETGKLPVPGAKDIRFKLGMLTDFARKHNIITINTKDSHTYLDEEISETPDFINTFPAHCMKNTGGEYWIDETCPHDWGEIDNGTDLVTVTDRVKDAIKGYTKDIILVKDRFDVFKGNKYAEEIIEQLGPDLCVVYGVAADVCVDAVVKGLLNRERLQIPTWVVTDAIARIDYHFCYDQEWCETDHAARLVTTREVIDELSKSLQSD